MRPHILVPALVAASLLGAPVNSESATPPPVVTAPALPAITVSDVAPRILRDRVMASGLVGPVEKVNVSPLIEGQPIEQLLVDVGDAVEAGQVLARLSDSSLTLQKSQFNASLSAARATVAQAEAQVLEAVASSDEASRVSARLSQLREQGSVSQAQSDQAQATATASLARVAAARQSIQAALAQVALVEAQSANIDLQLSRTEVKAPVAGKIMQRNAVMGAIASAASGPMFTIIRDNALEVAGDVAERDLMRLAPGQVVALRTVGDAGTLTGTVRLVEPSIDVATRLGRVRITINESDKVVSGMFIEAEIMVAEHDALAVPVSAVGSSDDGATVMKVTDGTVMRVSVQTGIREAGWVEITQGLESGDTIVTKAGAFVRNGDRINPVPATDN
ncbi:MAG: efflux RND transporter periplasmic adaptor subunit [Gemmobacter sp.]|nr:efflux RND transporter periplasmic adaptor subunit [Gemmobacter sp.]